MVIMREEEEQIGNAHSRIFHVVESGNSSGIIMQGSDEADGEATTI